jgi:hypothetical protein
MRRAFPSANNRLDVGWDKPRFAVHLGHTASIANKTPNVLAKALVTNPESRKNKLAGSPDTKAGRPMGGDQNGFQVACGVNLR